jgi:hypothetical protein
VEDLFVLSSAILSSCHIFSKSSSDVVLGFEEGFSSGEDSTSRRLPEFSLSRFKSSSDDCLCFNRTLPLSLFEVGSAKEGAGGLVGLGLLGFVASNETVLDVLFLRFKRAALMYTFPLNRGTFDSALVTSNHTYVFL